MIYRTPFSWLCGKIFFFSTPLEQKTKIYFRKSIKVMNIRTLDEYYSKALGIFNPYQALPHRIDKTLPHFDKHAYKMFPKYQFVYDKLFVAKSQGMKCGRLKDLLGRNDIEYPIFVKPRYGHKTASSKNCFKIKSFDELEPLLHMKEMMWSEFVNATEGMTDMFLVNGEIVYHLSYKYSEKQYGFADVWKYISPETRPPEPVVAWAKQHMTGFTGPLNLQYRADKIIEVGLRFARSGVYIESAGNKLIVDSINHAWLNKQWDHKNDEGLGFAPFYSFKSWSPIPLLYIAPQYAVDAVMKYHGCGIFYEYYFEPTGKDGLVFFQFMHTDFKAGMKAKKAMEQMVVGLNFILLALLVVSVYKLYWRQPMWIIATCLFLSTGLLNSIDVLYHQIKNQLQFLA
jgi:hypothetical protein